MTPAPRLLRNVRWGLRGALTDVLIRDGRVAAFGDVRALEPAAGVLDAAGGTLLPGMRDRHVHVTQWAATTQRVDLSAAGSAADAVAIIATADGPDLLWGRNFRDALWPDRPHRGLLDAALPGRAVALVSADLHTLWLSSAALQRAGIEHETGVLREYRAFTTMNRLADVPDAVGDRWVRSTLTAAAARGVTSLTDFEFDDLWTIWQRRALGGELPVRVEAAIHRPLLAAALQAGRHTGDVVPGTDGLVTVGPCKVLLDGSLNTRTAYCYADPGLAPTGALEQDPDRLVVAIGYAAQRGISFAVHAIGDLANTLALDCFERAATGGRIEHAQLIAEVDLPRFGALGVTASVQPAHAVEDRDIADAVWADRAERSFPYRSLLDGGASVTFGSDAPVSRLDPWHAIAAAVFRTGDDRPAWHPEQALTLDEAIAASTGGRTAPQIGDVADLVVTAGDPAAADRATLDAMPVRLTMVGGRVTFEAVG